MSRSPEKQFIKADISNIEERIENNVVKYLDSKSLRIRSSKKAPNFLPHMIEHCHFDRAFSFGRKEIDEKSSQCLMDIEQEITGFKILLITDH